MRPRLLMSDNTLSLNRARTISPRLAVIYARHYGRRVRERRGSQTAPSLCTRQWLANETIRPMHHRDSLPSFSLSRYVSIARIWSVSLSFLDIPFLDPPFHSISRKLNVSLSADGKFEQFNCAFNFRYMITKDGVETITLFDTRSTIWIINKHFLIFI